jgi:ABC-type nitrate/sulfonate/bicarbonate transport system permease component
MNDDTSPATSRIIQLAFIAIVGGAWYLVGKTGAVSPLLLPKMDAVWAAIVSLVGTRTFSVAVLTTLRTIAEAYFISVVIGVGAGYLISRSRVMTEVMEPVLSGLFAIPITLFFPLFILFFGIGPASKVAYGACYGVFPIAITTIAGLSAVEERYLRAARSAGFTAWGTFRHVLFPASFPVILTGLRVGFFICFASVLGGETISSFTGVGRNIALNAELMEPAKMYAWIVFVILTALVLNAIVSMVENHRRGS